MEYQPIKFARPYKLANLREKFNYWLIGFLCRLFGKKTYGISQLGQRTVSYKWKGYYHLRLRDSIYATKKKPNGFWEM